MARRCCRSIRSAPTSTHPRGALALRADSPHLSSPVASESSLENISVRRRQMRVSRACSRCKVKKTKCDGLLPCSRCVDSGTICVPYERRTSSKKPPDGFPDDETDLTKLVLLLNAQNSSNVYDAEDWVAVESSSGERSYGLEHVEGTREAKVSLDPTQFVPTHGMGMPFMEGLELEVNVIGQEDEPTIDDVFGPVIF
ncbi:hypothetical protein K456DRAFT_36769 [Colletotrichum gloeosporioides 23]|nr:hypothetical protein K456DRAFT_36769 [Colletotrichum gloeosporioides 23]